MCFTDHFVCSHSAVHSSTIRNMFLTGTSKTRVAGGMSSDKEASVGIGKWMNIYFNYHHGCLKLLLVRNISGILNTPLMPHSSHMQIVCCIAGLWESDDEGEEIPHIVQVLLVMSLKSYEEKCRYLVRMLWKSHLENSSYIFISLNIIKCERREVSHTKRKLIKSNSM